jgi:ribosomal protein L37E
MDTLHCKRCGNIWTEETKGTCTTCGPETSTRERKLSRAIPDNPEQRMEKRLEGYLKKSRGKFSLHSIPSNIGDIQMAMFRRYLKKCVRNRTLVEKKDRYGITWYSRPE